MVATTALAAVAVGAGLASAAYANTPSLRSLTAKARAAVGMADATTGYNDPAANGGTSLGYFPGNPGGEPLNIIISGASSPEIATLAGFTLWANALDFGKECFGLHSGTAMQANLGDGQGLRDQQGLYRDLYGEDPAIGACGESLVGGNHLRYWQQGATNAWFLATSIEENVIDKHTIEPDGYNKGRDDIVNKALANPTYKGKTYTATVEWLTTLLPTGATGIDHNISIDGRTAVLTITVTNAPASS